MLCWSLFFVILLFWDVLLRRYSYIQLIYRYTVSGFGV